MNVTTRKKLTVIGRFIMTVTIYTVIISALHFIISGSESEAVAEKGVWLFLLLYGYFFAFRRLIRTIRKPVRKE